MNRRNPEHGDTLLHHAANFPHPEIVAWLIKHGTNVNVKMDDGRTPLHRAAERNTGPRVCRMLLEANAEINAKDDTSKTPLSYAVEKNKRKVADFLREMVLFDAKFSFCGMSETVGLESACARRCKN